MTVSLNQQINNKYLVAVGNGKVYAEAGVAGTLTEISGLTVDTTDNLNMFSGLQKAFIVNGTNLKIVDFVNTKLTLSDTLTSVPPRGTIITQANSNATMVVDFINSSKNIMYGYTTSGTFTTNAADTLSGGGIAPSVYPTSVDEASTAPHGYDWSVYPDGNSGSLPSKAYLGCWYRGRAVLSGNPDDPHQWYMSRQLNPFDFAYVANDAQTPVAGENADAGKIGDIVRALIPFHDDYLIFGCSSSIYYLQGDPAAGGELHSIDDYSGIFGAMSWCFDKLGDLYFFSSDGLNRIKKGAVVVENISRLSIPELTEDEGADPATHRITLGYDKKRNGVLICITLLSDGSNSNYFYSIETDGLFPENYPDECGAYSMLYYTANNPNSADLLIGCRDGYIRKFSDSAKDDDIGATDQTISSEVLMPLQNLGENDNERGRLNSITLVSAGGETSGTFDDSDSITVDVHVADNPGTLVENIRDGYTPIQTETLSGPGRKKRIRGRARGKWLGVKLKNTNSSETWALDKLSIETRKAGRIK